MKKSITINIRPLPGSCSNGRGLINENNANSLQRKLLINEHQTPRNINIDLCAIGINDSVTSPKYMPGDDCPNECGGLFILLRHYTDAASKQHFANNETAVEKMICDICAKQVDWQARC